MLIYFKVAKATERLIIHNSSASQETFQKCYLKVMRRPCTKPKWTHVHWKQYWWKGDWLCSKFTYKYQKRSEHDFGYSSKLVFLDARQPPTNPPPPPPNNQHPFQAPSFKIYFLNPRLILTPHHHPGAPINYECFLIYSSRIHNWNSVCIKLSRIC